MPDGIKLAAKLWLPDVAATKGVPTIIEVIPYRKRDIYAPRDAQHHHYFAGYGYATMRVDIRGSGDSDGVLTDEYLQLEQDDALEVIAWIARQPWCSGAVGLRVRGVAGQIPPPDHGRYLRLWRLRGIRDDEGL